MSLHLYDTRTRATRPFEPVASGRVGIYSCGPTVQAAPHVGHLRSAVDVDVLRRWLLASGYAVTLVRNVTDVDDKILDAADREDVAWWALAERSLLSFRAAYDAVGVLPPTLEPRATGHIPQMLELIDRLLASGHAYAADGDVYFDVRSDPSYGQLSGQSPDALRSAERPDERKRDPLDFALWKGAKPGEPVWQTPWGPGRPGWHLECSAMSVSYLGPTFDIHTGGLDLIFPHHENELAQSTCAGEEFARFWLHHGLVTTGGEKMSKSLGNSLLVADTFAAGVRPQALRYHLAAAHYRSTLDHSETALAEAESAYARVESFVRHAVSALGGRGEAEAAALTAGGSEADETWERFTTAMNDDLGTPQALAVLHGAVRTGNGVLEAVDRRRLAEVLAVVRRMLEVLGLDPVAQWPHTAAGGELEPVVDALVGLALETRGAARRRKDYAEADAIRDRLAVAGVVVEDTPDGARWRLSGHSRPGVGGTHGRG